MTKTSKRRQGWLTASSLKNGAVEVASNSSQRRTVCLKWDASLRVYRVYVTAQYTKDRPVERISSIETAHLLSARHLFTRLLARYIITDHPSLTYTERPRLTFSNARGGTHSLGINRRAS